MSGDCYLFKLGDLDLDRLWFNFDVDEILFYLPVMGLVPQKVGFFQEGVLARWVWEGTLLKLERVLVLDSYAVFRGTIDW